MKRVMLKGVLAMALLANGMGYAKVDDARILTEASALAIEMTTNYVSAVKIMTESARDEWRHIWDETKLNGKQYFIPDFCKVKYTVVAAVDDKGFVMGMYNPFYDCFMVFLVDNSNNTRIGGVKIVPGSQVTSRKNLSGIPPAHGISPCEKYFTAMLQQVGLSIESFSGIFKGKDFRTVFSDLPRPGMEEREELMNLVGARTVKATDMVRKKDVFAAAALSRLVVSGGVPDGKKIIAADTATETVAAVLKKDIAPLRASLKIVSWFSDGDSRCFLFASPLLPTFMLQTIVDKDGLVKMQMFDANLATDPRGESKGMFKAK